MVVGVCVWGGGVRGCGINGGIQGGLINGVGVGVGWRNSIESFFSINKFHTYFHLLRNKLLRSKSVM